MVRAAGSEDRREIEFVPLEEIGNAMAVVVERSGGMDDESVQREALALFGGKRLTPGISQRLQQALRFAESTRRIERIGAMWQVGEHR